ncbi:hypothetical protein JCM6294_497 [Bacteroides pyogenes DSM 20611 = JCM 6294]|uniref:Uncharacterized protein n=1 Tax=Bacteroides pyogenes DSM 20611 = JCM 6294 TaxID=1121100 RepID=W4PEV9_9BACE|nr:hypothetical protein JCM6294_497 [Bacteroides pyogenes DSM 20611 = JCM 6294]
MRQNRAFIAAKQSLHCGKTEPSFRQNGAFIAAKQSFHCGETELSLRQNRAFIAAKQSLHFGKTELHSDETELLFFPKAIHSGEEVRNNSRFQPILGVFP